MSRPKKSPYPWLTNFRPNKIAQFTWEIDVPSSNHIWKTTREGRTYLTNEGREFKELVRDLLARECLPFDPSLRLGVEYTIYVPSRGNRDLGNYEKILTDAMCATTEELRFEIEDGYLIPNDRQIDYILLERKDRDGDGNKITEPWVRVFVGPLEAFQ